MAVPNEVDTWDLDDVQAFALRATAAEVYAVADALATSGSPRALELLKLFLFARGGPAYEKRLPAILSARALLQAGPPGVQVLSDALTHGPRPRYASSILMMLWRASRGDFSPDELLRVAGPLLDTFDPPAGTSEAARRALSDHMAEALVNPRFFTDIGGWLQKLSLLSDADPLQDEAAADVASLLGEASIRLSPSILGDYAALIAAEPREELVQQFLTAHPALLDPLAASVFPKHRLGTEYATDFAVRRHDDRWLLVEIEKPQDSVFTAQDNFSAPFTHAYGQVLDFQRWVDDDVAYARSAMPGIVVPRGLLVIGRRAGMTERQQKKLAQLVSNSARIDVLTFDDLLRQATVVYDNLHRHPTPRERSI
jgi:hypothetical protein